MLQRDDIINKLKELVDVQLTLQFIHYHFTLQATSSSSSSPLDLIPIAKALGPVLDHALLHLVVKVVEEGTLLHLGHAIHAVKVQFALGGVGHDRRQAGHAARTNELDRCRIQL